MTKMPLVKVGNEYVRRLHPFECQITKTLQPLSTVDMTVPPMDEVEVLDWVKIESPDGTVEYYRVSNVTTDAVTGNKSVSLEHGACTLDDIIIPESTDRHSYYVSGNVRTVLTSLLSGISRWTVGTVEDTESVYIEPGGSSVMTAILTMMSSIPDYQLEFVQESESNWHIDIIHRPTEPICECRLSRNLKTCDITYTKDGICTRVNSDQLPNGYLDSENKNVYGLFEHDVSINENLSDVQKMRVATAYLAAHDHPAISISISGLELSQITGLSIDSFKLGTVCRIAIPWLGIVRDEVIVDKTYNAPYNAPEDVSFTLANATPDLSLTVASVTGGGGGGGIGKAGLGGQAAQLDRYETEFKQTKEYFKLIATENEYDTMGNKTVTAYGQMILTHDSFQVVIDTVGDGSSILDGGTATKITPATIAASINKKGSQAYINADHVYVGGTQSLTLESKLVGVTAGLFQIKSEVVTIGNSYDGDGKGNGKLGVSEIDCDNITCSEDITVENDLDVSNSIICNYVTIDDDGVTIADGTLLLSPGVDFKIDGKEASWQSMSVVTSVTITMPSISVGVSHNFLYETSSGTQATVSGRLVSDYSRGSTDVDTDTIYYLGRSQA